MNIDIRRLLMLQNIVIPNGRRDYTRLKKKGRRQQCLYCISLSRLCVSHVGHCVLTKFRNAETQENAERIHPWLAGWTGEGGLLGFFVDLCENDLPLCNWQNWHNGGRHDHHRTGAVELVRRKDSRIGLGSGRAAQAFVRALAKQLPRGPARARGANFGGYRAVGEQLGIPLLTLAQAGILDMTIDGRTKWILISTSSRAMAGRFVREKIVAASSRRLVILVGENKLVPRLGTRGKLPVEVTPFGLAYVPAAAGGAWLRPFSMNAAGLRF